MWVCVYPICLHPLASKGGMFALSLTKIHFILNVVGNVALRKYSTYPKCQMNGLLRNAENVRDRPTGQLSDPIFCIFAIIGNSVFCLIADQVN